MTTTPGCSAQSLLDPDESFMTSPLRRSCEQRKTHRHLFWRWVSVNSEFSLAYPAPSSRRHVIRVDIVVPVVVIRITFWSRAGMIFTVSGWSPQHGWYLRGSRALLSVRRTQPDERSSGYGRQ